MTTENTNTSVQNNSLPYIIIIVLLVVIAVLAFFVGKNQSGTQASVEEKTDLNITIIDDKRCTDCGTQEIVTQIKALPFLAHAQVEVKDFSDAGAEDILKKSGINILPAVIFSNNKISDYSFVQILKPTTDGQFQVPLPDAKFDPYAKRSERGFLLMKEWVLENIKANSHLYGEKNAEITWVEYSDVECGYCKKLHNDGTHDALFAEFGKDVNLYFQYFSIFNKEVPEVLECMIEQKGTDIQYPTLKTIFKNGLKTKKEVIALVEGIDEKKIDACIAEWKYKKIIETHMKTGSEEFRITGTPGNVLINNKTWEYQILPGAYPVDEFKKAINSLKSAE